MAKKRLEITKAGMKSQLAPQEADVNQRRAAYELRLRQLDDLKVKAGMNGVLQVLPVEVGASVQAGAQIARVADPTVLKAELRIAETQTKDIKIGQVAEVDTQERHRPRQASRASIPRRPTERSASTSRSKAPCRRARGRTSASTAPSGSRSSTT